MAGYYTPEEVAEKLKLHINTVWRYLKSGRLQASRIGNRYRISEEQFQQFLTDTLTSSAPMTVNEESTGAKLYGSTTASGSKRISAFGKHPIPNRSSEDFMREKHQENEREEHRRKAQRKR